jgi:hypothetical protein
MNNHVSPEVAAERARDRDWEAHHGAGDPEPERVHTAETWRDEVADELLADDAIVDELRVKLSRALHWAEQEPDNSPEARLQTAQALQSNVLAVGTLILKAALKNGLSHQKMGVDE